MVRGPISVVQGIETFQGNANTITVSSVVASCAFFRTEMDATQ